MKYKFPTIKTLDDAMKAFDEKLYYKAEKANYTVLNYHCITNETFPDVETELDAIKREFRGMIFDEAGNILRRPLHKFFNVGERAETKIENIDVSKPHHILAKLDGSMIAPFKIGGEIIWGTKMGYTDVTPQIEEFINNGKVEYIDIAEDMLSINATPIFEWCSRSQRIVVDYEEDALILVAIRDMHSGEYASYETLQEAGKAYNIPVVGMIEGNSLSEGLVNNIKGLEGIEGFIVRFEDGHMAKIKCDWYCALHRVKSDIEKERGVVALIINEKIDDLKPLMCADDLKYIENFEFAFTAKMNEYVLEVHNAAVKIRKEGLSKKDFSLGIGATFAGWMRAAIFATWDADSLDLLSELSREIKETTLKNCNKEAKYQEFKKSFPGLPNYNLKIYLDA